MSEPNLPTEPFGYEQVCPIYQCGEIYHAVNQRTKCPGCNLSVQDMEEGETNDPDSLRGKEPWWKSWEHIAPRMESPHFCEVCQDTDCRCFT